MDLPACIDKLATRHGSLRAVARASGCDAGYLSRLRSGCKTEPSEEVLTALGIERVVSYRLSRPGLKPIPGPKET